MGHKLCSWPGKRWECDQGCSRCSKAAPPPLHLLALGWGHELVDDSTGVLYTSTGKEPGRDAELVDQLDNIHPWKLLKALDPAEDVPCGGVITNLVGI